MKKRFHYGWVICISCTVLMVCTMGFAVNAFSIYMPYIQKAHGFTSSQLSLVPTVRSLFSLIALLTVDKYFQKTGLRAGVAGACLMTCTAFVCSPAGGSPRTTRRRVPRPGLRLRRPGAGGAAHKPLVCSRRGFYWYLRVRLGNRCHRGPPRLTPHSSRL
jgi:hypothetical protein